MATRGRVRAGPPAAARASVSPATTARAVIAADSKVRTPRRTKALFSPSPYFPFHNWASSAGSRGPQGRVGSDGSPNPTAPPVGTVGRSGSAFRPFQPKSPDERKEAGAPKGWRSYRRTIRETLRLQRSWRPTIRASWRRVRRAPLHGRGCPGFLRRKPWSRQFGHERRRGLSGRNRRSNPRPDPDRFAKGRPAAKLSPGARAPPKSPPPVASLLQPPSIETRESPGCIRAAAVEEH